MRRTITLKMKSEYKIFESFDPFETLAVARIEESGVEKDFIRSMLMSYLYLRVTAISGVLRYLSTRDFI